MGDLSRNWDGLPYEESGCRYILDSNKPCGQKRKDDVGSYCPKHHTLCYLTPAEAKKRWLEIEALARVVGGRFSARRIISAREMRRIERQVQNG